MIKNHNNDNNAYYDVVDDNSNFYDFDKDFSVYENRHKKHQKKHRIISKRLRNRIIIVTIFVIILAIVFLLISSVVGMITKKPDTSATKPTSASTQMTTTESTTAPTGPVDDAFFDNTVFVGDSITYGFSMYIDRQRNSGKNCLGKSFVLANGSLGYINAQTCPVGDANCKLPIYKGVQQNIEDSIADMKADRVYILLGMNDVALSTPDEYITYVKKMTDNIKAQSPKIDICLESITPRIAGYEDSNLNNVAIKEHNVALKKFAEENNYSYINLYDLLCDKEGNLKEENCGDPQVMGLHFSNTAYELVINYLYNHPNGETKE